MRGYSTKTFSNPTVQMQQRLLVNPTSSQPGISSEVKYDTDTVRGCTAKK